jgi:hypothetical protein
MMIDPEFQEEQACRETDIQEFIRTSAAAFRDVGPGVAQRRLLVVNSGSLGQLVEIALIKAFELAGYRPVILTDYDRWVERYFKEVGITDLWHWEDFATPVPRATAEQMLAGICSFEDLIDLRYSGVRVGKYAASTALRHLRVGRPNVTDPVVRKVLTSFLHRSICYAHAAKAALNTISPHLALSVDLGYSPRGELFDSCLAAGLDTITWNAAHRNNQLMLKRYTRENHSVHPASLSWRTWQDLQVKPWTDAERVRLQEELVGSYVRGEWYAEVGTQFHTEQVKPDDVRNILGLDRRKKTAVIFSHIFWDGTFFYGMDLFGSYEEWFLETLKAACVNRDVNWVVKLHPANIVKNSRDGVHSEPSEITAIRSLGDALPGHIHILLPDSRMSTLSLYSIMDYCVTVRGTVGIEAASFGIPVLTAGTGRYDRLGFTIDSDSKAQYLDRLTRIANIPPLSADQRGLAERFAYGVFVLRPLRLRTVTMEYQRDAKASLRTKVSVPEGQTLRSATDLRSLAEWIQREEEDYLDAASVRPA